MNIKRIVLLLLSHLVLFALGFLAYQLYYDTADKGQIVEKSIEKMRSKGEPTTRCVHESDSTEINYAQRLKGKYIIDGAHYAGFDFVDAKTIGWTNELFPNDPDTMRLDWINKNTFVCTFNRASDTNCRPMTWIQQIVSLEGSKLKMKEINTGWNSSYENVQLFFKEIDD